MFFQRFKLIKCSSLSMLLSHFRYQQKVNFTKNKARKTILTDTEDIASISADRASYKHNTNTERPSEDGVQFVTSNSD